MFFFKYNHIYILYIYYSNYDNMKKTDQARDMDLLQFHAPRWPPWAGVTSNTGYVRIV